MSGFFSFLWSQTKIRGEVFEEATYEPIIRRQRHYWRDKEGGLRMGCSFELTTNQKLPFTLYNFLFGFCGLKVMRSLIPKHKIRINMADQSITVAEVEVVG